MRRDRPLIGITTDVKDDAFAIDAVYSKAISLRGGSPVMIPSLADKSLLKGITAELNGVLLPGGRDMDPKHYGERPHPKLMPMHAARTESEMIIIEQALKQNLPVLGICGGMQTLNVFFGGSLFQDIPSLVPNAVLHQSGAVHEVEVEAGSLLHKIVRARQFSVKSYHHQSVNVVGGGLSVSARCPDGIIEALESADSSFILGIQWHPEREEGEISERIFLEFIERCKEWI